MKLNIKSLIGVLLFGTTITACNEFEDFDSNLNPNFAESLPKGYYESSDAKNPYGVVYTENAEGKDVLYIVGPAKKDASNAITYVISDDINYDKVTGTLTAVTPVDSSYHGFETKSYISFLSHSDVMPMQMIYKLPHFKDPTKSKTFTFGANIAPSKNYPNVNGLWIGKTKEGKNLEMALKAFEKDGKTTYTTFKVNDDVENIEYTYDNNAGVVKGEKYNATFSYNERYQMVVVFNGENILMDRVNTPYKPEEMIPIYDCMYIRNYGQDPEVAEATGWPSAFEQSKSDAVLYQSDKDPSKYTVAPWYENGEGLIFFCDENTLELTFEPTMTGYGFNAKTPVMGYDIKPNLGIGSLSMFNKKATPKEYSFNLLFADDKLDMLAGVQIDKLVLMEKIESEEE